MPWAMDGIVLTDRRIHRITPEVCRKTAASFQMYCPPNDPAHTHILIFAHTGPHVYLASMRRYGLPFKPRCVETLGKLNPCRIHQTIKYRSLNILWHTHSETRWNVRLILRRKLPPAWDIEISMKTTFGTRRSTVSMCMHSIYIWGPTARCMTHVHNIVSELYTGIGTYKHNYKTGNTVSCTRNPVFQVIEEGNEEKEKDRGRRTSSSRNSSRSLGVEREGSNETSKVSNGRANTSTIAAFVMPARRTMEKRIRGEKYPELLVLFVSLLYHSHFNLFVYSFTEQS